MTTAVVHVSQVRTGKASYGQLTTRHKTYVDNDHFICREPVRESCGLTCSSCDALIDTAGECRCSC